jgi:hypothetical protein
MEQADKGYSRSSSAMKGWGRLARDGPAPANLV